MATDTTPDAPAGSTMTSTGDDVAADVSADVTATDVIVSVTEVALAKVLEIRSAEDDPETLGLRIEVTGLHGVEYAYDLSFDSLADAEPDDVLCTSDGLTVVVPANSVDALRGATLDVPSNPSQGGLVIRNPNRPDPLAGMGELELTGSVAEKVTELLEKRINPALAAHGGFASFVGVEGPTVYVSMGGGCQGCSMSAMTLSDGIKRSILEAIPEVTEVVDATNHEAGENPFYS
jgi:Fe/S biogenesis protein NfuA